MSNFETIEIIVRDGNYKKLDSFKWAVAQWENLEKTWSYLRRKYGKIREKFIPQQQQDNWISE